jgi:hypothetical protein
VFQIKTDPKFPHHYIIGVGMHSGLKDPKSGQLYLKYTPVYFHNKDVSNLLDSLTLMCDSLYKGIYKTTDKELLEINECSELVNTISSLKVAARANNITLHHFSTEDEIPDPEEFFERFVERGNNPTGTERRQLVESIVGGC